jgi:hypothetical protein
VFVIEGKLGKSRIVFWKHSVARIVFWQHSLARIMFWQHSVTRFMFWQHSVASIRRLKHLPFTFPSPTQTMKKAAYLRVTPGRRLITSSSVTLQFICLAVSTKYPPVELQYPKSSLSPHFENLTIKFLQVFGTRNLLRWTTAVFVSFV